MTYSTVRLTGSIEKKMVKVCHPYWYDPSDNEKYHIIEFDKEIIYNTETTSSAALYINDQIIKKGSTFTDYYGFGNSIIQGIDDALEICQRYKIDINNPANCRLKVNTIVQEKIYLLYGSDSHGRDSYIELPRHWFINVSSQQLKDYRETPLGKRLTTPVDEMNGVRPTENIETWSSDAPMDFSKVEMVFNRCEHDKKSLTYSLGEFFNIIGGWKVK